MLVSGSQFGGFEIRALLGVGGMGEVYLARDTRLGRDVALKVLPDLYSSDADRLARFDREAQVLASLNHPRIAAIYGVAQEGAARALVLELVTGQTLADRVARGPLAPAHALHVAVQIADALEAAHERGIVHRDLKPSNVVVGADGPAKVLDFGLAKLADEPFSASAGVSRSPTISSPAQLTRAGTLLGTAAYMSPEQVNGAPVDARSDVWAFGVVLYEMLTGRRAFDGDSVAQVVARVLEREVDLRALPAATPPLVRRVIARCLIKTRDRRLRHIADARLEIEEALAGASTLPATSEGGARLMSRPRMAAVAGAIAFAVLGTFAAVGLLTRRETPAVVRSILTTVPTGFAHVAISPDGTRVVYDAGGTLYMRPLDQLEPQPLRGTEGGQQPVFSPDGRSIAFFMPAAAAIRRIAIDGGPPTTVARTDGGNPLGLSWGEDGTIVFATDRSGGLWRVSDTAGEPERLTRVVEGEAITHQWPFVLPNGQGVLFAAFRGATSRVAVASLAGEVTYLVDVGSYPRYTDAGYLLYANGGALWAARFDQDGLALVGTQRVDVLPSLQSGLPVTSWLFDIARNGSLIYVPGSAATAVESTLVWIERSGRQTPISLPARRYSTVRVSPEGTRVVAGIIDPVRGMEIWVSDLARPALRRLSTPPQGGNDSFPAWMPDGERIVFGRFRPEEPGFFWTRADGTGDAQPLLTIEGNSFVDARAWSPDGQSLLFSYGHPSEVSAGRLSMTADGNGAYTWAPFIERAGGAWVGGVSPDGEWIAVESADSGQREIHVERYPELGGRRSVSVDGGSNVVWSPDNELFYRRPRDGAMMAVRVTTTPDLTIGPPQELFGVDASLRRIISSRSWDLAPDGRFLMLKAETTELPAESRSLHLIQ